MPDVNRSARRIDNFPVRTDYMTGTQPVSLVGAEEASYGWKRRGTYDAGLAVFEPDDTTAHENGILTFIPGEIGPASIREIKLPNAYFRR